MIYQLLITIIYYAILVPLAIILGILTSVFIYWKYFSDIEKENNRSITVDNPELSSTINSLNQQSDELIQDDNLRRLIDLSKKETASIRSANNRIVVTKNIDLILHRLLDNIIEYYILSWYRPLIILDEEYGLKREMSIASLERFQALISNDFWILISSLIDRLYNGNHLAFISQEIVNRVLKHFQKLKSSNDDAEDDDNKQCSSDQKDSSTNKSKMFQRHRKQLSTSSITSTGTNLSSFSSEIIDSENLDNSKLNASKLPEFNNLINKTTKGLINNLNPFSMDTNKNEENLNDENDLETEMDKEDEIYFPIASHLFEKESEQIFIRQLMRFIVETLLNDITNNEQGLDQDWDQKYNLKLLQNSKTFKTLLTDLLSITLFNFIDKMTLPKTINSFIIAMVKRYAVLKNLFYDKNASPKKRRKARFIGKFEKPNIFEDDDDDDDEDDNDDDNVDNDANPSKKILKKDIFFLEQIKQCIIKQEFDHLLELIDKCQNIRILKQIRLKLIAETLDAAVVLHLNQTSGKENQNFYSNDSDLNSEFSKVMNKPFNFNAPFNLKFKRFKKTKNLKKLVHRLRLATALCEQKIKYRKRFFASLVSSHHISGNSDDHPEKDHLPEKDLTKKSSGSIKNDQTPVNEMPGKDSFPVCQTQNDSSKKSIKVSENVQSKSKIIDAVNNSVILVEVSPSEQPKQKKIFKFIKIMANKFSRDYFKTFLKKSLFQNDPTYEKRAPLTKFRKDILLIDCSVYMLEFWEQLQEIFEKLNLALMDQGNDEFKLFNAFFEAFQLLLTIIGDQRFFYTFSKQFLSVSNQIMNHLERFLLGDIELDSLNICNDYYGLDFDCNNDLFKIESFEQFIIDENLFNSVLKKIDWEKYLSIFFNLERILFNCFNEEFYPQFLISNEYDQLLNDYFSLAPSEQELLMNLNVLNSEKWHQLNQEKFSKQNRHFHQIVKLSKLLELKPINKIHLFETQIKNKGENDTKLVDLFKNRNMLLNSLEFPFVYLGFVKYILLIRLKLKLMIMVFVRQYELCLNEKMETNQLNHDLMQLLDTDIKNLLKYINQIHLILMRTFSWLQADFSCNITDVYLNEFDAKLKLSSTLNTAETKLFSLIENLFKNSDPHSTNTSNDDKNSTTSTNNKSSSNLIFKINVSALLCRFKYNSLKRSIPLLAIIGYDNPESIIAEVNSNWQQNWTKLISFNQLQQFYRNTMKPFVRINIFLESFCIRNYLSIIMNLLNENENFFQSNQIEIVDEENILDNVELAKMNPIDSSSSISDTEISDLNTIFVPDFNDIYEPMIQESKILVQFLRNTDHLLNNIKRKKWLLSNESKYLPEAPDSGSGSALDSKKLFRSNSKNNNNNNNNNVDDDKSSLNSENSTKCDSMSFKKLLELDIKNTKSDVFDALQYFSLPEVSIPETKSAADQTVESQSSQSNPINKSQTIRQLENMLSVLFQQFTAQENIIRSKTFIQLIDYGEKKATETEMESKNCLRCNLNEYLFKLNQDGGLNYHIQIFLFRLFFEKYKPNDHFNNLENADYLDRLIDELLTPFESEKSNAKRSQKFISSISSSISSIIGYKKSLLAEEESVFTSQSSSNLTLQLLFLQIRSLLSEKSSTDCFDYVLDTLNYFAENKFCNSCQTEINKSKRNLIVKSQPTSTHKTNEIKFRLFNFIVDDAGSTTGSSSSSRSILSSLFRSKSKSTSNTSEEQGTSIPDLLQGLGDETTLLSFDENQLIEPLFELLFEIFELKGGTVKRTLRKIVIFCIRLFFDQTKLVSRPYRQFLEQIFAEENVFKALSFVNNILEQWIKDYNEQKAKEEKTKPKEKRPFRRPLRKPEQKEKIEKQVEKSSADIEQIVDDVCVMIANELESKKLDENDAAKMEEELEQLRLAQERIEEENLQILAKQLVFACVPTFLHHLFGFHSIEKGLNKCLDILQYQQLNKQLIYEFIEAFMLEFFSELRTIDHC